MDSIVLNVLVITILFLVLSPCFNAIIVDAQEQLRPDFYEQSCPPVFNIVRSIVQRAVYREPRMAASLLRLHFHDCFVNGCDGSDLLDDTPSFVGEKNALPNQNSLRGFEVIDAIKCALEENCQQTVSCADILAIAARDAVVLSGGPSWAPLLGRLDGLTASASLANQALPYPFDSIDMIIGKFKAVGLSAEDVIVLSGSHTMGSARCSTFSDRLYNFNNMAWARDPSLSSAYASHLEGRCPAQGGNPAALNALDPLSPDTFDNAYYVNLLRGQGLLHSDQQLFCSGSNFVGLCNLVHLYASNQDAFFADFAASMMKMGSINPCHKGEIRTFCRHTNLKYS